jgi:hypothetical protein
LAKKKTHSSDSAAEAKPVGTVLELIEKTRELYLEYPDWLWLCLLRADDDNDPELFGRATELIEDALATCWLMTWDGEYADGIVALQVAIDNAGSYEDASIREC